MAIDSSPNTELASERTSPHPAEAAGIDATLRTPLVALTGSAVVWLLIASVLGLAASWKLHAPAFLDGSAFFTYGRVQAAASNAFIYGWGFNAAFGVALWLMARLSRAGLPASGVLIVGSIFWNAGLTLGIGGILLGYSTSIEWLELPGFATPLLLVAYAFIASWAFVVFKAGRSHRIYASQWYVFAALFWFPWLYSVAQVMLVLSPVRGTVQSVVHVWFSSNLFLLWFASIALAAIYYFLPKLLLKPIANYYLSSLGFWWLAIFGSWAGISRLIGGPVPAWVQTVGAAASFMLAVPLLIIGMNHYGTLSGRWAAVKSDLSLRFIAVGIVAFTLVLAAWVLMSIHGIAAITQFTYATVAHAHLGLYGFFSMVAFGSLYYILPRVLGAPLASVPLANVHFWTSLLGTVLLVGSLAVGGVSQGLQLADPAIAFSDIVKATQPWLFAASVALVILAIGQVAFAINFFWTLGRAAEPAVRSVKDLLAVNPEATR